MISADTCAMLTSSLKVETISSQSWLAGKARSSVIKLQAAAWPVSKYKILMNPDNSKYYNYSSY